MADKTPDPVKEIAVQLALLAKSEVFDDVTAILVKAVLKLQDATLAHSDQIKEIAKLLKVSVDVAQESDRIIAELVKRQADMQQRLQFVESRIGADPAMEVN